MKETQYNPDYIIKPCEFLSDILKEANITVETLSKLCGLSIVTLNQILEGKRKINKNNSIIICRVFGIYELYLHEKQIRYNEKLREERKENG